MSQDRDDHIKKIIERAQRDKSPSVGAVRGKRATTSASRVDAAKPTSAQSSVSKDRDVGKNGRQSVEPKGVGRVATLPKSRSNSVVKKASVSKSSAKSSSKSSAKSASEQSRDSSDSELHIWFSLLIFFISGYLFLCCFSYLIYWEVDADIASFANFFGVKLSAAHNWGGKLGAVLSNLIMGRFVGVMGLIVPLFFTMWGLRLLRIPTFRLKKSMVASIAIMFAGSLALGQFCGRDMVVFGSGWGGESGIYISEWLSSVVGREGTSLLVVFISFAVLFYSNAGVIKRFGRLIKRYFERREQRSIEKQKRVRAMEQRRAAAIVAQREIEAARQLAAVVDTLAGSETDRIEKGVEQGAEETSTATTDESVNKVAQNSQGGNQDRSQGGNQGRYQDRNQGGSQNVTPDEVKDKTQDETPLQPLGGVVNQRVGPQGEVVNFAAQLIALQGEQWGYIYDYDFAGNPYYCYLDRSALVATLVAVEQVGGGKTKNKFVEAPPKEEPQKEEDIEFTVYDATDMTKVVEVAKGEPSVVRVDGMEVVKKSEEALPVEPQSTVGGAAKEASKGLDFAVQKAKEEEKLAASDINTMPLYDPTAELSSYRKPMVELLRDHTKMVIVTDEELKENKDKIVHTLLTFGIKIDTIKATIGPTVTLYEIVPAPGVRISKIRNLEDDIALTLSALGIRIIAPIPGKGTIGIEVPNQNKEIVSMYSVVRSAKFQDMKAELPIALGKTIQNETFVLDLAKMPHLLVAGATGQGKSVGLNAIITSLLYKKHPSELKFVLIDPKKVELTLYSKLEKHFLAKMEGEDEAIITDTQKVVYTLNSLCKEMDARYDLLKMAMVRNIVEYNDKFVHRRLNPQKGHRYLPYFVVIIDEFADLIMTAGREIETPIARIAQLARAVGIHLIIATQRPTTNIITGVIKANFPARIAFRVASMIDSRTILDTPGANQLIGKGDMLVSTGNEMVRVQCAFVDTPEVADIVDFISTQRGYVSAYELPEYQPESESGGTKRGDIDKSKRDVLFEEVARFVVSSQSGSASTIQRKFSIGFNRAGRLIDQFEAAGIVGSQEGSKPRQVLISDPISLEMILDN